MRELIARLDARQGEQVEFLARLVNHDGGTDDVLDVNRVGAILRDPNGRPRVQAPVGAEYGRRPWNDQDVRPSAAAAAPGSGPGSSPIIWSSAHRTTPMGMHDHQIEPKLPVASSSGPKTMPESEDPVWPIAFTMPTASPAEPAPKRSLANTIVGAVVIEEATPASTPATRASGTARVVARIAKAARLQSAPSWRMRSRLLTTSESFPTSGDAHRGAALRGRE